MSNPMATMDEAVQKAADWIHTIVEFTRGEPFTAEQSDTCKRLVVGFICHWVGPVIEAKDAEIAQLKAQLDAAHQPRKAYPGFKSDDPTDLSDYAGDAQIVDVVFPPDGGAAATYTEGEIPGGIKGTILHAAREKGGADHPSPYDLAAVRRNAPSQRRGR